jgi:SSS family solute:Na+ symporter|tara:strand:- start:2435 stop:3751 length:1317 start_codon:yes stop_codon:yes gene_type:complete
VNTTGAFFVAGRSLGPVLLFSTLLAANIGAGSTMGAAGIGYTEGFIAWWWVGSAGIGTILLAIWVGPRVWRIAKEHDLQTMGDLLELRYGRTVRGMVTALLWVGTLFVLAGQLIAVAFVLQAVADIPKIYGCLIGGVVMTSYFAAGGLLSSAWVNLVQLAVLIIGFALVVPVALSSVGGLSGLTEATTSIDPNYTNPWRGGSPAMYYVALLVPAFIVSPGLIQKIYGARDARTVRVGVAAAGVALLIFASLPPILGAIARVHFPELESQGLALPTLLVERIPLLLGALGLAAIFSAEVSSADAILFMLATSLSKDLYQRFLRPGATDNDVLRVARLAALAGGALGVGIAIWFETIVGALSIFYSLLSVSLFVPVIAAIHSRDAGRPEAFAAILAGVLALLAVTSLTDGRGYGTWNPTLIALLVSGVAFGVVFIARRRS